MWADTHMLNLVGASFATLLHKCAKKYKEE
jgi:hypothetical protein